MISRALGDPKSPPHVSVAALRDEPGHSPLQHPWEQDEGEGSPHPGQRRCLLGWEWHLLNTAGPNECLGLVCMQEE